MRLPLAGLAGAQRHTERDRERECNVPESTKHYLGQPRSKPLVQCTATLSLPCTRDDRTHTFVPVLITSSVQGVIDAAGLAYRGRTRDNVTSELCTALK